MKSIVITGGTGFVGSYLLESLVNNPNYKIILLKKSSSDTFRISQLLGKILVYNVDEVDLSEVFKSNKIDGVIHLATCYKKEHSYEDINALVESNVLFPTKLAELSVANSVKFFINTGTFFEYNLNKNPINEENKIEPYNLYASTKVAFDAMLKYYALNSSLNILTLKLSAPFGYNDNHKLIPYLIKSVLNDERVILEKGEQEWDFIYVKDVVSAYIKAIELCINSKRTIYEEIFVGSGERTSVKKIANIINNIHGKELIFMQKDYSSNQIFSACIDNSKAKNILQWVPQYSVQEALSETFNLYKENKK